MKLFFQMQSDQQHNKSLGVSLSLFVLSTLNMTRVHKLGPQQCTLFEILITVNSVLNGLIVFNGHFIKLQ